MRGPVGRKQRSAPRPEAVLACAWCGRVRLDRWVPLEKALARLHVRDLEDAGPVTHGICRSCLEGQLAALAGRRLAA